MPQDPVFSVASCALTVATTTTVAIGVVRSGAKAGEAVPARTSLALQHGGRSIPPRPAPLLSQQACRDREHHAESMLGGSTPESIQTADDAARNRRKTPTSSLGSRWRASESLRHCWRSQQ